MCSCNVIGAFESVPEQHYTPLLLVHLFQCSLHMCLKYVISILNKILKDDGVTPKQVPDILEMTA